jgi:hypothetical protein
MRILANEDFPGDAVTALRECGYDSARAHLHAAHLVGAAAGSGAGMGDAPAWHRDVDLGLILRMARWLGMKDPTALEGRGKEQT